MSTGLIARHRMRPGRIARGFRITVGLVYLFGAPTHVYVGLVDPDGYRAMSEWSPPVTQVSRTIWESWFIPNARYLALLLVIGELTIATLILARGWWTRLGFAFAATFHVALAALFGMWVYTVPMAVALAYMTAVEFSGGPAARLVDQARRRRRRNGTRPLGTAAARTAA
jgi:hypothetical protein